MLATWSGFWKPMSSLLGGNMTTTITKDGTARAQARRAARSVVTHIGTLTVGVRIEPTFIIAGAQRCATTSLFRMLTQHPQIVPPPLNKGIHYFDTAERYAKGPRFYRGHFPLRKAGRPRLVTGEASPYYVFHPLAMARIATELPRAQVVVLLRDPVERAFSGYKQELARGFETLPTFEQALDAEEARLAGEESRIQADPTYQSFAHQHFGYVARGRYTAQLRRAQEALGEDRLTILDLGRLVKGGFDLWDELLKAIGVSPWRPDNMIRVNDTPTTQMQPATRQRLTEVFAAENNELAEFLGYPPSWCH